MTPDEIAKTLKLTPRELTEWNAMVGIDWGAVDREQVFTAEQKVKQVRFAGRKR
jgi:hypothetical protein